MLKRKEIAHHLFNGHKEFDVIVIGGGITGLWTALDATTRGFHTLLLEANDFSSGASSKSSKLIHGGIRYLKQGHLGLVREALIERAILLRNAPHLVTPKSFLIGCYSTFDKLKYCIGMHLYNTLAAVSVPLEHLILSPERSLEKCPTMNGRNLKCSVQYFDGQVDDSRLVIELFKTVDLYGGHALNYCSVEGFLKTKGKISGVIARDKETDKCQEILSKVVINATGTFTDYTRRLDNKEALDILALSRGTHIVVDRKFFPSDSALVIPETPDKRLLFVIPWLGKVLIGTTDIYTNEASWHPKATEEEIEYILSTSERYLTISPRREDILSTFAGLRPLAKSSSKNTSKLSRKHKLEMSKSGLFTVCGGKYTTARKMAEDILNMAIKEGHLSEKVCKTKTLKIHKTDHRLEEPMLHPNLPYSESDIIKGINEELAIHVMDLLARRTRSCLLDANAAKELIPKIARIMAKYLEKDEIWIEKEIELANSEITDFYCK